MSWQHYPYYYPFASSDTVKSFPEALKRNEQCFIRKEHKCDKIFGASKSCFIACPTDDDIEPILELMSEKLAKIGVEPIIAVKERAYGQDIFCTKICGKIIESKFCIVILDDTIQDKANIPNPNVYYEYGLMTSIRKHIIPLQKDGLDLAFNIQSYDTIKYTSKNIGSELDRAIKDAVRITERQQKETDINVLSDKTILRKMEMAGFTIKEDDEWTLHNSIEDTKFKGFINKDEGFYSLLGKIDDVADIQTYVEDLDVVTHRIEKLANGFTSKLAQLDEVIKKQSKSKMDVDEDGYRVMKDQEGKVIRRVPSLLLRNRREYDTTSHSLAMIDNIVIGFIVGPNVDIAKFKKTSKNIIKQYKRYKLAFSTKSGIKINDINVSLSQTRH